MRGIFLSLFLVWAVQGLQAAPTNYVATSGSDITGDGSYNNPWLTIGKALQNAGAAGVNIYVGAGTYTENLTFGPGTNNVVLKGGFNTNGWAWAWDPKHYPSIINGNSADVITVQPYSTNTTISYFTLTGAGANDGIQARYSPNDQSGVKDALTVEACIITNNGRGINIYGGAANEGGTLTVKNCIIARNSSYGFSDDTDDTENCQHYFYNCTVVSNGNSGIRYEGGWQPTLTAKNCIFAGNVGYGAYHNASGSDGTVENE